MSSHVMVVDTSARSVKIKTLPDKQIIEILNEACAKLSRDPSRYGFK